MITDLLIIEQVINATGKGAYRSVKKILKYIIPLYVEKEILDPAIPTIHLRISDDRLIGFNTANSNNFCPWCEITKNQCKNGQNNWIISKSMSSLNENLTTYFGHKLHLLFNMISLKNHVLDKLHIMLYITDHLWKFEFWNIHGTNNWNYTSLIDDDKLCVLQNFNLTKLFDPECATLIKSLWDRFAKLYDLLKEKKTDPQYFHLKVKAWYKLFLKKMVIDFKTNTILE
ncbi:hypothetical protein RhiirA4_473496 [Rhizophagus irregularis]|uniref:Uncharacterized protein n=1 Tax=Rhizophagus irregularis TaxID=588596 RepID=A0A2I1H6V6_9GLOM|nr:hypothetical protein RhiirA4_473496 [Rhizophagus irregularis]